MKKTPWGLVSPFLLAIAIASPAEPPAERSAAAPFDAPVGELTLRAALSAVLGHGPELAPSSWELRAREAEALGAGRWANPELGVEIENLGGSGDLERSETTITLSQLIELGGKRGKRRALAERERALADWDYETARLDALTATTHRFLDVLGAQEHLRLAEELLVVSEEIMAAVSRRVRAGGASPVEASRAKVEAEILRIERAAAERALVGARSRLAAMWAGTPEFSEATGELDRVSAPPAFEALAALADRNPSLARWSAEAAQRAAALELARAASIPDFSLGAGVRRVGDDTAFLVELDIPLPLFDRNRGATEAASIRHAQVDASRRATRVRIHSELETAHESLATAYAEIEGLRGVAIPEATAAFEAAQRAYLRGSMRFTDVLDTERLLFELRGRRVRALVRYHRAVADIERIIGGSFDESRSS